MAENILVVLPEGETPVRDLVVRVSTI